jgi:ABC-type nickel/cobalt efflux system permease component RcnA
MPRPLTPRFWPAVTLAALGLVLVGGGLWALGALDGLAAALREAQRVAQDHLASAIRALRGGEPGALAAFWGLCLAYGVLHAAGPGHGKMVIGGYALARRVPVARLAGIALAASLAQAAVAVGLVYALVAGLGLARGAVQGAAEDWLAPTGHALIAGLGLWLVWRGVAGLWPAPARHGHGHDHGHGHGHDHGHVHGPHCAHAHGPTIEEVARVTGWRDAVALIAGIALRPCTGALFVLVLTWQLGIVVAGVIGAFVMGLGTALVTVGVAVLAATAREGALAGVGSGRLARALPILELTVGGVIALVALRLLADSL